MPTATAGLAPSPTAVRHQKVGAGIQPPSGVDGGNSAEQAPDFGRCWNPATRLNGAAPGSRP